MAGVNIGNVGLTFTRYLDGVSETLNQTSKSRRLVRKDDKWTGSHIEWRVHTARNHALGYVEDGGAFPVPDKQDYQAAKAYRKFVVGSIQLTDGVMATAAKSRNVARDVITSEVQGMMNGILKFENGMFFRNGDGSVATVQTGTATTALKVDDARMLWDGAKFQVYDSGLSTNRGNVTVSKTASAPNAAGDAAVTLSANVPSGTTTGDLIVWDGALNRGITGLAKLVDDTATTFQNINVSNFPRYSSLVLGNSGTNRELTPTLFRQVMAGLMQKSGADKPAEGLTVLTNAWQAINVEELYEGELRLDPSSKVAGLAVASFQSALGRVDMLLDTDAPYNKMYFVDFSQIYRAVQKKLGWRREGGSIFKRSDTAGVWTATAMEICELYIKERHTSARLDDLSESPGTMY
jgi:hypothetical protein